MVGISFVNKETYGSWKDSGEKLEKTRQISKDFKGSENFFCIFIS